MVILAKAELKLSLPYIKDGKGVKTSSKREKDGGQGSTSAPRRQLGLSSF